MFAKLLSLALVAAVVAAVTTRQSAGGGRDVVYVVKPYDTLWSIAEANYGGDPREGVWKLQERNRLVDTLIRPGMRLVLAR